MHHMKELYFMQFHSVIMKCKQIPRCLFQTWSGGHLNLIFLAADLLKSTDCYSNIIFFFTAHVKNASCRHDGQLALEVYFTPEI